MKLMLGTTELADIDDDMAEMLVRLFAEPGRLRTTPRIGGLDRPTQSFAQLQGSPLGYVEQSQDAHVILELTATTRRTGPLVDGRDYDRIMGR